MVKGKVAFRVNEVKVQTSYGGMIVQVSIILIDQPLIYYLFTVQLGALHVHLCPNDTVVVTH